MKRIGIVFWSKGDGVATLHSQIVERLGYEVENFYGDQKLPECLDLILLFGPWGSMLPLTNQLIAMPPAQRPRLVWWLSEQLPNPALPEWLRYGGGLLRTHLERLSYVECPDGSWKQRGRLGKYLASKATRFRYYGDLLWLKQEGILTCVVQGSGLSKRVLEKHGFRIYSPPTPSSFPEWGADLKLERKIPVLWIGKVATRRRRRLLEQIEGELARHGVQMLRIDGERHPYVFGDERTVLLNRTKVVLNLLRAEWDNNAMRFHLAALNRALVVTEPMVDQTTFVPGVHLVEAPIEEIPDRILHYLAYEDERQAITEQAYQLITRHKREDVIAQLLKDLLGE